MLTTETTFAVFTTRPSKSTAPLEVSHNRSTDGNHRRTLDPSRPINDNCGWEHVLTDLTTFHDYADAPVLTHRCETVESITTTGRSVFLPPLKQRGGKDNDASQTDPGSAPQPQSSALNSAA
jgi:hypothetical protein